MMIATFGARRQAIDIRPEGGESRDRPLAVIADYERLGGEVARQDNGGRAAVSATEAQAGSRRRQGCIIRDERGGAEGAPAHAEAW